MRCNVSVFHKLKMSSPPDGGWQCLRQRECFSHHLAFKYNKVINKYKKYNKVMNNHLYF